MAGAAAQSATLMRSGDDDNNDDNDDDNDNNDDDNYNNDDDNAFRVSEKTPEGPPVELENQFILRLPEEPAGALREAIKEGASNLKERLFIQLEPDKGANNQYLRKGHVQFDKYNFTSRLLDLPTIMESHKTIDNKFFYKTADICQLLVCKEGEGFSDDEEPSSPVKKKKLDPYKVDNNTFSSIILLFPVITRWTRSTSTPTASRPR